MAVERKRHVAKGLKSHAFCLIEYEYVLLTMRVPCADNVHLNSSFPSSIQIPLLFKFLANIFRINVVARRTLISPQTKYMSLTS